MQQINRVRIAFLGSGGDGVMSVAAMLLRAAAEHGLYGIMAQSYGPQIRGGESAAYVNISENVVTAENFKKEIIICYSLAHAERFKKEFGYVEGHSVLIYDEKDKNPLPDWLKKNVSSLIPIPFTSNLEEASLPSIAKNVYTLGILSHIFNWELKDTVSFVEQAFLKKGPDVVNSNIKAFKLGKIFAESIKLPFTVKFSDGERKLRSVTGNVAAAEAAIAAGCRFFAGYPITPSSEVLDTFIKLMPPVGGKVVQAEDEIASLGMVIGASYGGVSSMTATSGPGLSLMTEMVGLSSMVEIPSLILDCQRGGPSTGIPSKTEQSDLYHAIYGGHGDFPRVVLAPTDVEDIWQTMFRSFYLAEKYQLPAIVLSDGYIAQRAENIPLELDIASFPKPERAKMEKMPKSKDDLASLYGESIHPSVNPVVEPGTKKIFHHVAGIEVDEDGRPSAQRDVHERMSLKRLSKYDSIAKDTESWFESYGDPASKIAFVAWGSTRGSLYQLLQERKNFKLFIPKILHPFPIEGFKKFLKGVQKLCFVELNFGGQLYQHVKTLIELPKDTISLAYGGGTPLSPFELENRLKETEVKEVVL